MIITEEDDHIRKPTSSQGTNLASPIPANASAPLLSTARDPSLAASSSRPTNRVLDEEALLESPPSYEDSTLLWKREDVTQRVRKRFLHSFVLALLLYIFVGISIGSLSKVRT